VSQNDIKIGVNLAYKNGQQQQLAFYLI